MVTAGRLMFEPGQIVCFESDPKAEPLRVKTVSPFVDMVELEEFEGAWVWSAGLKILGFVIPKVDTRIPDDLQAQLDFLGI